jgi:hypothetical protein
MRDRSLPVSPRRSDVPPGWANHGRLRLAQKLSAVGKVFINSIGAQATRAAGNGGAPALVAFTANSGETQSAG